MRYLYFADGALQSCIRLDRPDALLMDYSHAMMSALIFNPRPRQALLIGLGGCALVHFILGALPDCAVDVVEIRQKVIDLAFHYFRLPEHHPKLKVIHAAGQDFITQRDENSQGYDLILVDAFDEGGPATALVERPFLAACRERLNPDGIFAINVWNRPKDNFPGLHAAVKRIFGSNTLKLLLGEEYQNAIVFGFDNPIVLADLPSYRPIAKKLRLEHNVNFPRYLKHLYWQNPR
jgi:spermidine synthase